MSAGHILYKLAGRVHRSLSGIDREPVTHPDLFGADVLMMVWSALFGACFASLVLIAFFGDHLLSAFFGG